MLDLGHRELTHAQKTLSRRDLISEAHTDLSGSKRHPAIVELDQAAEVDKDSLGCLWAQEATHIAGGSDLILEHKIKWRGRSQLVARLRVPDLQLLDACIDLSSVVILRIHLNFAKFLDLFRLFGFCDHLLENLLDKFISASGLVGLRIAHHEVRKLVHVSGRLQHIVGDQVGRRDLEHVFLKDEVLAPLLFNVLFEG